MDNHNNNKPLPLSSGIFLNMGHNYGSSNPPPQQKQYNSNKKRDEELMELNRRQYELYGTKSDISQQIDTPNLNGPY
jgi:hypothetical protein